ncbi:DUF6600 domain-containing protein [Mucilaginibacter sp. MD40]|uniref:DUF6600 domain-containing protein n=1 Tax=Mucilaginibacter sp. MD40 TaxID=2029590 RepID=UPI00117E9966|nr:DUF6600 domain-containing protein [Mucilaginibacter sp. MD40]
MKKLNQIWGTALVALLLIISAPNKIFAQPGGYVSNQEFYDELAPYGTWVYDEQYGNVWIPDVDQNFRPYATNGYWAMTEYGNTWVSNYPWGWAAFHYGRWRFDNYYGWEWIPGSEWAPAWVSWRNGGGYYGWAPLEPRISINAYYSNDYYIPDNYWVFAPQQCITYPNIYNYYVPSYRVRTIIQNTTYINNTYVYNNRTYVAGPRRADIERITNRPVRVYNVVNATQPSRITVNNNNINIYRPEVRRDANARPARVVDAAAYRQQNPNQRIASVDNRRGAGYNPSNAARLAQTVRSEAPDTRVVRVNSTVDGRGNANPAANGNRPNRTFTPGNIDQQQQRNYDRQQAEQQQQRRNYDGNRPARGYQDAQQMQQAREQQRQQQDQQRQQQMQQAREQQRQQQDQQRQQQMQQAREQQRQQMDQQRQQQMQQAREQQRQQQEQQRQQQDQQRQQQMQQAREQQRQQQEQQRQQQDQQRQQQMQQAREQQRQQQEQQRQQQMQQAREQQRQQQEQQRQQQDQQRQQQMQQAREQQRQQQEQQRQQQQEQQRQQQEQQRQQQMQQAREQQRQQQEQQRQQQEQAREQQRQQQEQQRQPGQRPVRN